MRNLLPLIERLSNQLVLSAQPIPFTIADHVTAST